jgi:hypothetical protein
VTGLFVVAAVAILLPLGQQVLLPLATGDTPGPAWSWSSALAVLGFSLGVLALLGWTLHQTVNTRLDDEGLHVPGWRGHELVRWSQIERVSGRGMRIKLHAGTRIVTVNPLCYARPGEVAPFLKSKLSVHVGGSAAGTMRR